MTKTQVDVFKGWAILQVVVIHMLALYKERVWQADTLFSWVMITIDQLGRLSIPLFIFLSWYGLSIKYRKQPFSLKSFVSDRLGKLIPLYLLWSIGLIVLMSYIPRWLFAPDLPWTTKLLFGQADYQLYFIPLIVMLYLLFVVFNYLPRWLKLGLLPVLFVLTWRWFIFLPGYLKTLPVGLFQPDQLQYLYPITWLFYAWLGGVAAEFNLAKLVNSKLVKWPLTLATTIAAGWLVMSTHQAIHVGQDVLLSLGFTKISVLVFATLGCLWVMTLPEVKGRLAAVLQIAGKYSFLIFLSHTVLIRLTLSQLIYPATTQQWWVGLVGVSGLLISSWWFLNRQK